MHKETTQNYSLLFYRLFGFPKDVFSEYLIRNGKLENKNGLGFKSQLFDKDKGSVATSGTVIFCLIATNSIPLKEAVELLNEISSSDKMPGRFPDEGVLMSIWALGIVSYCESLLAKKGINREQINHRVTELLRYQNSDGGWSFYGEKSSESQFLFCFYPVLSLINLLEIGNSDFAVKKSIESVAGYLRRYKPANHPETLLLYFLATKIRMVGTTIRNRYSSKRIVNNILKESNNEMAFDGFTHVPSIPLFYSRIFVPGLLLSSIGLNNKNSFAFFVKLLIRLKDKKTPTFRARLSEERPYVWASALGILAAHKACNYILSRSIPEQQRLLSKIFSKDDFMYDVAISFSGKQRKIAETLYKLLKRRGYSVFYDASAMEKLVGERLPETLEKIYAEQAMFIIVIVSKNYTESPWAYNVEWRAILDRKLRDRRPYILPYRVDNSELEGLKKTVGYIERKNCNEYCFAEVFDKKFRGMD